VTRKTKSGVTIAQKEVGTTLVVYQIGSAYTFYIHQPFLEAATIAVQRAEFHDNWFVVQFL
jgi:hypothetical protein